MSTFVKGSIAWGLLFLWMVVIFTGSSQTQLDSPGLFQRLLGDELPQITDFLAQNDFWIRKVGHGFVYFILTLLAYWAFSKYSPYYVSGRPLLWAVAFSVIYAISDEYHQTLVPGRHGVYTDVIIDSIGVAMAALLIYWFRRRVSE
ncbi:VanZ family protein [Alkalicella caledoniensis]|nr:VanZ family protein [Alkalicella caledoniensis]